MAKESRDTKQKADKDAFRKFDALAKRIIRVPKDQLKTKSK